MPTDVMTALGRHHPVVIEGMAGYDQRDPAQVSEQMTRQLTQHWAEKPPLKPLLVLTQGDPRESRGISAITPRVASHFGISRCLICLDDHIADYHSHNADRENVTLELKYLQLAEHLDHCRPGAVTDIEVAVDQLIETKNKQRAALNKPPLKDYFRDFALLQEVTKASSYALCDEITVTHTSSEVSPFSVTSFYAIGPALGLVPAADFVPYAASS